MNEELESLKHVIAVPPGENAFVKRLDEFLYQNILSLIPPIAFLVGTRVAFGYWWADAVAAIIISVEICATAFPTYETA